jgi:hypothetical protein
MVEIVEMVEPTAESRLEKWALALRRAYLDRSPNRGNLRCLDAHDVLTRIKKRIAHENRFRPHSDRRRRPWDPRTDISDALGKAFPDDSLPGKLLRLHIYDQAEAGSLTPQEAEYWARVFRWRLFAAWADETQFDPNAVQLWSLGMAIKGVECAYFGLSPARSAEPLNHNEWLDQALHRVRQEWPAYIEQSLRWTKNGEGGAFVNPQGFPWLSGG